MGLSMAHGPSHTLLLHELLRPLNVCLHALVAALLVARAPLGRLNLP